MPESRGTDGSGGRHGRRGGRARPADNLYGASLPPRVPRTVRVNEVLREVIAEHLERLADTDADLGLLTVTGVTVDPDLRHATVWLASLSETARAALAARRTGIQAAIGREVRMKRTPLLAFVVDPAVSTGGRVEEILRELRPGRAEEAQSDG